MSTPLRPLALAAALVAAGALSGTAQAAPAPADQSTEILSAIQRDLGLDANQARERLSADKASSDTARDLRKHLDARFGGAWIDSSGTLTVGVTSRADLDQVGRGRGKLVQRSERDLDAVKSTLDRNASRAPRSVPGWYVDLPTNTVVVKSHSDKLSAARAFVAASGVNASAVRYVPTNEAPRPLIDVIGGNAYNIGSGTRCSVGFSVNGGFVTAGHCGTTGASTSNPSGSFRGSSFPGNDYAWVQVAAGNTPRGLVNNYSGGTVSVAGSQDAAVGATVCRSGSTTGWHCGTIQARNSSVSYPQGTVTGLIQTTVCAEPGDSGGSLVAGNQAQGVTSGGSGNCRTGGTTYFQPVNEILQAYGLSLITSGGGNPNPPTGCATSEVRYNGSLAAGGQAYQPNNSYYQSTVSGAHVGCLAGPTGADFDLYLEKWNGSAWAVVAKGDSPAASETVNYNGTAGYYRFRVHAYSGSGSYTLGVTNP
ncbi:streptogrisin C [Saccharothrix tamanrassetensis]|uniref:Streptogrisin C n=1 Tax=Saccharothrix tamanrassetensis TaxID=1051531 RepID=A0A841CA04_9PSEU|nr:S1 family peptidase [Saccharothrix tamanrassetensis]MBB5954239.1 streptogrisin C [Saccharothrix tamanrassetensis]